jgi:hypothetical protein
MPVAFPVFGVWLSVRDEWLNQEDPKRDDQNQRCRRASRGEGIRRSQPAVRGSHASRANVMVFR